jgi:two-component system, cell cycle response regulator DivK
VRPASPLVLLVDDEAAILDVYGDVLTEAGFRVVFAINGQEAIDQARTHKPDVIVMDLKMPGLDGYATTRRLKADRRTRAIPVVAFTGDSHDDKALAAGCIAIIKKPCTADAFIDAIQRHVC